MTPIVGVIGAVFLLGILGGNFMNLGTLTEDGNIDNGFTRSAQACVWKNDEFLGCNHNVLTTEGADYIEDQIGDSPSATLIGKYVGVSNDSSYTASAAHGETEWVAVEAVADGLNRATGTYGDIGTGNWWINYTWTATGTTTNIKNAALLTNGTGGTLIAEAALSSTVNLENGDTLKIAWNNTVS